MSAWLRTGLLFLMLATSGWAVADDEPVTVVSMLGEKPYVFSLEPGFPGRYERQQDEVVAGIDIDDRLSAALLTALEDRGRKAVSAKPQQNLDALYAKRNTFFANNAFDSKQLLRIVGGLGDVGQKRPLLLLLQHRAPIPQVMGGKEAYGYGLMRLPSGTLAFLSVQALLFCEEDRNCGKAHAIEYVPIPGYGTSKPLSPPGVDEYRDGSSGLEQAIPAVAAELLTGLGF